MKNELGNPNSAPMTPPVNGPNTPQTNAPPMGAVYPYGNAVPAGGSSYTGSVNDLTRMGPGYHSDDWYQEQIRRKQLQNQYYGAMNGNMPAGPGARFA